MAAALLMFLIALAVVTVLKVRWLTGRRLRLPPGPKPDPFIGNLRQMSFDNQAETFILWGKTYGAVFPTMHVWWRLCGSPLDRRRDLCKDVQQACNRPKFLQGRPRHHADTEH